MLLSLDTDDAVSVEVREYLTILVAQYWWRGAQYGRRLGRRGNGELKNRQQ